MVSRTFIERELRTAAGDHKLQVGWQASDHLVRFVWDVTSAVAREALRRFHQTNRDLQECGMKERRRLLHGPVHQAIKEVLLHPERHLPGWLDGPDRPPRPPRR